MNFNWAGHVLEASSTTWDEVFGNIHNHGHNLFGSNKIEKDKTSYMGCVALALRDPIFFRWHKRIDNLWQKWNNTQVVELAEDAPPVLICSADILIKKSSEPLNGFETFDSNLFASDEMTTYLGPPVKLFERDYKISHDPFFYHIRFQRNDQARGDLNLTFRIFICPQRQVNNRSMYIEMDKFVYRLAKDQKSGYIIRSDRHSSVIRRFPNEMEGNIEQKQKTSTPVDGYCECGWPYSMLLPRGTQKGEQWKLCVFVSDNNRDAIKITSKCGSMSYCGAKGKQYPDRRSMGYPFTTYVSINGDETSISNAIDRLDNAAMSDFAIRNNIAAEPSIPMVNIWTAWKQLNVIDVVMEEERRIPETSIEEEFSTSNIMGRMRVLIREEFFALKPINRISIRFQGRGTGNGVYRISDATLTQRSNQSLNIVKDSEVRSIFCDGERSFDVPEMGIITDELEISSQTFDLFVTFTLLSPGCLLKGKTGETTNTWILNKPVCERASIHDWDNFDDVLASSSIYCVESIMLPESAL